MTDLLIIFLLIILIFKDKIPINNISKVEEQKIEEISEEEKEKHKALQKQFDELMNYNIEDAIKSKRGEE